MAAVTQRAILKGHIAGTVATRNMFVGDVDLVSPDTYFGVWSAYIGDITSEFTSWLSSAWHPEEIEIQNRSGSIWDSLSTNPWPPEVGSAGDQLANLVAVVFLGKAFGNRKYGRKFWSPITEAAAIGNTLVSSAIADFAAGLVKYISPYTSTNGSVLQPGIITKEGTFRAFTSGYVSSLLGTIRRRKPGRGI